MVHEHVNHIQKRKLLLKINSQWTQLWDRADKDFKATILNLFKVNHALRSKDKSDINDKKIRNHNKKLEITKVK